MRPLLVFVLALTACGREPLEVTCAGGYRLKIDRGTDAACVTPDAPSGTTITVECAG